MRKTVIIVILMVSNLIFYGQEFTNYDQEVKNEEISIDMIAVQGGTFNMGAADSDQARGLNEKPRHAVSVDDFWIGKYEITWEQYDAFVYGEFDEAQFQQ